MKKLIAILLLGLSSLSYANVTAIHHAYAGNQEVGRAYVIQGGWAFFGVGIETPSFPDGTCNYFNSAFKFDATTDAGKQMLNLLQAAKISKLKVDVWYTNSSASGTDQNSGCSVSTMSTATALGLSRLQD